MLIICTLNFTRTRKSYMLITLNLVFRRYEYSALSDGVVTQI